jgi:ABC-type polysaccharide/polyol phosphate export permease
MSSALQDRLFLLRELTARDLKLRYIGSAMGLFWSVIHPLLTLAMYTLVFSLIIQPAYSRTNSVGSFAVFLFAGLLPWIQFHESISRCAGVFLENGNLIKKVKFQIELLPESVICSSLSNQLIAAAVFTVVLWTRSLPISADLLWLVPALLLQFLISMGLGLIVASANVFVRDIHQFLNVGFPFLFWATPIVYPPEQVPARFKWLSEANPLTHLVALFRAAFLQMPAPRWSALVYLSACSAIVFWAGRRTLRRARGVLADYV